MPAHCSATACTPSRGRYMFSLATRQTPGCCASSSGLHPEPPASWGDCKLNSGPAAAPCLPLPTALTALDTIVKQGCRSAASHTPSGRPQSRCCRLWIRSQCGCLDTEALSTSRKPLVNASCTGMLLVKWLASRMGRCCFHIAGHQVSSQGKSNSGYYWCQQFSPRNSEHHSMAPCSQLMQQTRPCPKHACCAGSDGDVHRLDDSVCDQQKLRH